MSDFDLLNERKEAILASLDFNPPAEYINFILSNDIIYNNQHYSYLSECGDYLYAVNEVITANSECHADEFYPGYFLIGSNGGGEAYAIEKASARLIMTPFIGHDEETPILIGRTWPEFLKHLRDNDD